MRRDIFAGCIGLVITAMFVFSKRNPPVYKRIEYSPFVHKPEFPLMTETFTIHPASNLIHSSEEPPSNPRGNTYTIPDGIHTDTTTIDELMQLPLESGGIMVEQELPTTVFIKYIRFQCTKIRNSTRVVLGGFRFLYNQANIQNIQIWNPHTGESRKYVGDSWSDSDQLSVIFCFSEPVEVNRYELKSSTESVDCDPVQWKMEGSMNGSFWTMLDDRTKTETGFPKERDSVMNYIMKDYVG